MKLGTVIICTLLLIGCAYTVGVSYKRPMEIPVQESSKPNHSQSERERPDLRAFKENRDRASSNPPTVLILPRKDSETKVTQIETIPSSSREKTEIISKRLFRASLAFVMKDNANIDEDIKAQLLIDPREKLKELEKKLTVEGAKFSHTVRVAKIVKANIIAPNFDIIKITEEEQVLSDTEPTQWLWKLSPKTSGKHEVNLTVTAILMVDGRETKHHLKTFEKVVTVEITNSQRIIKWLIENWKWVISSLIVPLILFLLKEKVVKLLSKKTEN